MIAVHLCVAVAGLCAELMERLRYAKLFRDERKWNCMREHVKMPDGRHVYIWWVMPPNPDEHAVSYTFNVYATTDTDIRGIAPYATRHAPLRMSASELRRNHFLPYLEEITSGRIMPPLPA